MTIFEWLASLILVSATVAALAAEPHCPGNVASLRLRPVHGSQAIVPVMINHTGPYDYCQRADAEQIQFRHRGADLESGTYDLDLSVALQVKCVCQCFLVDTGTQVTTVDPAC
jgi:hypothetical protein